MPIVMMTLFAFTTIPVSLVALVLDHSFLNSSTTALTPAARASSLLETMGWVRIPLTGSA
jgi:hypothetical protein